MKSGKACWWKKEMIEENVENEGEKREDRPIKNFVVRCNVKHAMGGAEEEFMDTIPAYDQDDAKDFVAGWMAERDFIVKKWLMVSDMENLSRVARNLNP